MPAPTFLARSLTELISLRAAEQPDKPAVHTGAAEFGNELKTLTYSQISRAVDRLAKHYSFLASPPSSTPPPERIISVLVSTAVDESLLEIALAKLGLTALLLSVNNSPAAVAHLAKQTKSSHLIYGPKFEQTAQEVEKTLKAEGLNIGIVPEKRFPLWGAGGIDEAKIEPFPARLTPDEERMRTCVILHSSGSTGFPKPVYITHYGLIANLASALPLSGFSALPVSSLADRYGCLATQSPVKLPQFPPLADVDGESCSTASGISRCELIQVMADKTTPYAPPPQLPMHLSRAAVYPHPTASPPYFREYLSDNQDVTISSTATFCCALLAETDEGIKTLASFKAVSFAGAAVPDDLGDRLVAAGVNLISIYGTTETGGIFNSRRKYAEDKAWNWCRAEGLITNYLQMEPQGGNSFELVVKDGWPAKIMSNRPDGSYATKDLFLQHPEHSDWYKYIGRLDDTLTQTLGEKTNPVPIELAIRGNSPLIQECIVFGDGRPQVGCLILPSEQAGDLWKDRAKYLEAIWPVIADANANAPTHSRILPEMVGILPADTDIPVATKMSILRPACYKKFDEQINAIYERFENGNGQAKQNITDIAVMEAFLKQTIVAALGSKHSKTLSNTTDLFAYGVDSLQATRIRNVISKTVELNGKVLGQNVVFEHPSIAQLAAYLIDVVRGNTGEKTDAQQEETMLRMVDKWSQKLVTTSTTPTDDVPPPGLVVVLTGATGSLGAHILDQLTADPAVSKVICLSRAKSHEDSLVRIQDSLRQRMRSLSSTAAAKIFSLAADVNKEDLGLSSQEYEAIRSQATAVIHNAWPVNFVLSIESFDEHIGGAVNLINLTLKSPFSIKPAFYFSSSVGTRQGRPDPIVSESFPDSPSTAAKMGYGRSKWVVEKVCERASQQTPARVGILRIGQLVGDTENGVWNETEAWPLMFKAVDTIHALPMLEERLSWLPVDLAAKAIREIVTSSDTPKAAVYHVLNPADSGSFKEVAEGLRMGGKTFDIVDRVEWLRRLTESDPDVVKNPTYKLLSFYQGRIGNTKERPRIDFSVERTKEVAPTIAQCKPISAELVALWTRAWRQSGFMQ